MKPGGRDPVAVRSDWWLILALCAPAALAQTVLPPVEVKGSYEDSIGVWDAASQGAVMREAIEKRPLLRPAEARSSSRNGRHPALR